MLNIFDFHSFIQRPHFIQIAENPLSASFFNLAVFAGYKVLSEQKTPHQVIEKKTSN